MEVVQPNSHILLRVASGQKRLIKVVPNTTIALGRFGSFPANALIGRPYYLTWDVLDAPEVGLKLVSVRDVIDEQINAPAPPTKNGDGTATTTAAEGEDPISGIELEDSAVGVEVTESGGEDLVVEIAKDNREIRDDRTAQTLTAQDIEELKRRTDTDGGREIISKLLSSHAHIDKKTSFSLAKYTLRKAQKYLKRITVLPVDVPLYTNHLLSEKEPMKIMEIRDEGIGLMMSWADVKWGGRWLVVDETGGLIVAAVAERMGLLMEGPSHRDRRRHQAVNAERKRKRDSDGDGPSKKRELDIDDEQEHEHEDEEEEEEEQGGGDKLMNGTEEASSEVQEGAATTATEEAKDNKFTKKPRRPRHPYEVPTSNTITLLHPLDQPNLSQLKSFSFDVSSPASMGSHPLSTQLLPLTYLQLLSPDQDPFLNPPPEKPTDELLKGLKANKRTVHAKRYKRWEKQMKIIESTRKGGFDGVIIATGMELGGILNAVVPLVRGSGQVVIYSPNAEPLAEVADWCSTLRRSEFQRRRHAASESAANGSTETNGIETADSNKPTEVTESAEEASNMMTVGSFSFPPFKMHEPTEDFPIDPQLLLAPTLHTSRMRRFQALPGRTHPLMTSRGGSEGYVLHSTRVLPVLHEVVRAMGTRLKPRKRPAAAAKAREEKEKEKEEKKFNVQGGDSGTNLETTADDPMDDYYDSGDAEPMSIDDMM